MKKKNTKLKKFGSIENEEEECNAWFIEKVMGTNMVTSYKRDN